VHESAQLHCAVHAQLLRALRNASEDTHAAAPRSKGMRTHPCDARGAATRRTSRSQDAASPQ
jgi:hypothetical protein